MEQQDKTHRDAKALYWAASAHPNPQWDAALREMFERADEFYAEFGMHPFMFVYERPLDT